MIMIMGGSIVVEKREGGMGVREGGGRSLGGLVLWGEFW
jgi:hypothetical protein